jgi:hypothetical protein
MAYSVNTAIVPVSRGEAVATEVSLAAAAARKKRQKKTNDLRRKALSEGDRGYSYVQFHYANGGVTSYKTLSKNVRTMLLPTPKEDKGKGGIVVRVDKNGKVLGNADNHKLKSFRVSFGKTQKKDKKTGKNRLVQSYHTVAIPDDCDLTDILHWVDKWGKRPAIIKYGDQTIVISADRAKKGAGAVG